MNEELTIYGFGSYFNSSGNHNDIDLIIVHHTQDIYSCRFASRCKKFLAMNLVKPDITLLSRHEEQQMSFIAKSNACFLGLVRETDEKEDLLEILCKIDKANNQKLRVYNVESQILKNTKSAITAAE